MQGLGKRLGPNRGWSFTSIIAYGLFFAGLLVYTNLAIHYQIYNLYQFLSCLTTKCDMIYVTTRDAFFWDILTWSHYLIAPLYRILIIICCELIYDIAIDPIYFWKLFWNPKVRLIWQKIRYPKGGFGRYETKIKPDDTKLHHKTQYNLTNKQLSRQRRNKGQHNKLNTKKSQFFLLQLIQGLDTNVPYDDGFCDFCCNFRFFYRARSESKEMKRRHKVQSKDRSIEVEPIKGCKSNMYMHSYYQTYPASMNKTSGSALDEKMHPERA